MAQLVTRLLSHAFAVICVSAVGVSTLVIWESLFRQGATMSGLNPRGGGPGFLLLLPPAAVGVLTGLTISKRLSFTAHVLESVLVGAAVGLAIWLGARLLLPAEFPSVEPLASGAGVAYVVSRIVVAALGLQQTNETSGAALDTGARSESPNGGSDAQRLSPFGS